MSFSEVYSDILLPFIEKYKDANEKGKIRVVKDAVEAVSTSRDLLEDQGGEFPKNLNAVRYFSTFFPPFNYIRPLSSSVVTLKPSSIRKQPASKRNLKRLRKFTQYEML
jgi:hypothetical protein